MQKGETKLRTRVALRRLEVGLTQEELAGHTGLSVETIRLMEAGTQKAPRLWPFVNVARVLDVPVEELLEQRWKEYRVDAPEPANPRALHRPKRWTARLYRLRVEKGLDPSSVGTGAESRSRTA